MLTCSGIVFGLFKGLATTFVSAYDRHFERLKGGRRLRNKEDSVGFQDLVSGNSHIAAVCANFVSKR